MPLSTVPLALPPDVTSVTGGDVDGDGRDELIFVTTPSARSQPDRVVLTVQHLGADGTLGLRTTVDLGNRALLWDVDHGLWGVDRDGLVRLDPAGGVPVRLARFPTVLAGLGPTTPVRADFARDLDDDGVPELVAWSAGAYLAFRADGTAYGRIPAPARGRLDTAYALGGEALTAAARPPVLVFGDMDGDGAVDLLLPTRDHLQVYYTGATVGARAADVRLPLDLEPEPPPPGTPGERREIAGTWLQDLDGDRTVDLGVSRYVHDGSWFGTTAEWVFARGTGSGFAPMAVTSFAQAAFDLRPADLDGDGDQDLRGILADVGVGNLARALVSRAARGDLTAVLYGGGGYTGRPLPLRSLTFPIESFDAYHLEIDGDVDGDHHLDLVTDEGGPTLKIYRGTGAAFAAAPTWEAAVAVPRGDGSLFVHDLTGDGRAEIVVWGQGRTTATLVRVP